LGITGRRICTTSVSRSRLRLESARAADGAREARAEPAAGTPFGRWWAKWVMRACASFGDEGKESEGPSEEEMEEEVERRRCEVEVL
jgi:hypothetical protein